MAPKAEGTCREAALPKGLTPVWVDPRGKGGVISFGAWGVSEGSSEGSAESFPAAVAEAEGRADSCKAEEEDCWLARVASFPRGGRPVPKGLLAGAEPPSDPCRLGGADPKPKSPEPCRLAEAEPNPKGAEAIVEAALALAPNALFPATPNALLGADPKSGSG